MNLYIMRHGETKMNKENLHNGQIDEDLSDVGISQAKDAIKNLEGIKFDIIYCSPLKRARHTCSIININNTPVIYDDRLKERTLGALDGKNIEKEGLSNENYYDYYYKSNIKGFEEWKEIFSRVHVFLDELKTKNYKNVLIVAHGGILRATHYYFNSIPEDGNLLTKYKGSENCQINRYEL